MQRQTHLTGIEGVGLREVLNGEAEVAVGAQQGQRLVVDVAGHVRARHALDELVARLLPQARQVRQVEVPG